MDEKAIEKKLNQTMTDLVSFGYRYPGSEAEKKAAQYILKKLRDGGLHVEYEEYKARCYRYTHQYVSAKTPEQVFRFESHPIWLSKGGCVSAPIYYAGYGTEPV